MASSATSQQQSLKDEVLKLLSDAEIGKVSMAETKKSLQPSEQFVDLDNLGAGVQTAGTQGVSHLADIIPRNAVDAKTWDKIITRLQHR